MAFHCKYIENQLINKTSFLFSDQQLQILEILQNNGEQLFPDEHGEVEIEIAKCCLGSVKQVKMAENNWVSSGE